jgi:hypothetical protein
MCVVVDERGIVLGRLRRKELDGDAGAVVEDVMELGPPTERPDPFLSEVIERLRKIGSVLITWYGGEEDGGKLMGVLFREDVERVLEENERLPHQGPGG